MEPLGRPEASEKLVTDCTFAKNEWSEPISEKSIFFDFISLSFFTARAPRAGGRLA